MIHRENVPQCLCGHIFSYWKSQIKASELENGRFFLHCPDCQRELHVCLKTKQYFEIYNTKDEYEKPIELDRELTGWTYVGERSDGSNYVASVFDSEERVKQFCEDNKFVPVAIGSFKITYKSLDKKKMRQA